MENKHDDNLKFMLQCLLVLRLYLLKLTLVKMFFEAELLSSESKGGTAEHLETEGSEL